MASSPGPRPPGGKGPGDHHPTQLDTEEPGSGNGSTSQYRGQRKSKAKSDSTTAQGGGASGGDHARQHAAPDEGNGSTSQYRGQRKSKAKSDSTTAQGGGASGGDHARQHAASDEDVQRDSIKEIAPTVPLLQVPTLRFELKPTDEEIQLRPLSFMQWEHIFNQENLHGSLCKVTNIKIEKGDDYIKFTPELHQSNHHWIDTILEKLDDLSTRIRYAERLLSIHHFKFFEEKWKLQIPSKQKLTCLFQREKSTSRIVFLADDENLLKAAEETADAILRSMEKELKHMRIVVPFSFFDESCFQQFVGPEKWTSISVWYEKKDEKTHEIHLLGPKAECVAVGTAVSQIVMDLKKGQVEWPAEAEVWFSLKESQEYLEMLMQEKCPNVLSFMQEKCYLIGRAEDVQNAQHVIQNTICTEECHLSAKLMDQMAKSIVSDEVSEKVRFITEYYLLASFDSGKEVLKLTGPKERLNQFLQKHPLESPSEKLKARIQSTAPEVSSKQMEGDVLIKKPILETEETSQMAAAAVPKSQSREFEEKTPQPRKVSKETLMKLLELPAVKAAVDTYLVLPKRQEEGIQWKVDKKGKRIEVTGKDKQKCTEIENEIWALFTEKEIRVEKADNESMKRLHRNWPQLETKLREFSDWCCIASLHPKEKVVHLAGLQDRIEAAHQHLTNLMNDQETSAAVEMKLTSTEYNCLMGVYTETLDKIFEKAKENGVDISLQPDPEGVKLTVKVTGPLSAVSDAVKSIQQLQSEMCMEKVKVSDALLACLTSTDEGKKLLASVKDKYKCCIIYPNPSLLDQKHPLSFAEGTLPGGTKVSLQKGPLRVEKGEMVALPVPVEMGGSSSSAALPEECPEFLKGLGDEFAKACKKLKNGDQRVVLLQATMKTSHTKVVLFKVPSKWDEGTNGEKDFMRSSVKDLLELVLEDQSLSAVIDVPIHLPVKAVEKQILFVLCDEMSHKGVPFTGIKSVKLSTKRTQDPAVLLSTIDKRLTRIRQGEGDASIGRSGQVEFPPRTERIVTIAGSDKAKTARAVREVLRFQPSEKPSAPMSTPETAEMKKDISKICPNLTQKMTLGPKENIEQEVSSVMRKLIQCSVSSDSGILYLHCSAQKEMLALDICQQFEAMVSLTTNPPSRRSERSGSGSQPPCEFDEIVIRAAKHLLPKVFTGIRCVKKGNGKVVLSPSLGKEDQDLISSLFHHEIEVTTDKEMKKAETVRDDLQTEDAYAEFIPAKSIIAVFTKQYKQLQVMIHRIKVHMEQIKPTSRNRRQIPTQIANPDRDDEEASAAAPFERKGMRAPEATGEDNIVTLPGGLQVIPYKTNITELKVDAIVNAANEHLRHGAGVAKAISDAAGPKLDQECRDYIDVYGPIPVSEVCTTAPGRLPCTRVIHAVGPRWSDDTPEVCRQQLYRTVLNCCREAEKWELKEIAMPAISSNIFGMPKDQCTEMYCKALLYYDQQPNKKLKTVHFVDIKDDMPLALLKALRKAIGHGQQRTKPPEADVDTSEGCVICTENKFDQLVKLNDCNHVFCKACIEKWFQTKPTCPSCNKVYGVITGTMPHGTMNVSHDRYIHLAGFENFGCIVIDYYFADGVQKEEHPYPGQRYRGTTRTAYLPDNPEGNKVLGLLQEAWHRKLTFTIGRSTTTGRENVVTWNDIHHKTSLVRGHAFGYPDPDYLTRVQEELAARGVTEESIKLSKSGKAQDFSQFYTPLVPPKSARL